MLPHIKNTVLRLSESLGSDFYELSSGVWVHKTAIIAPTAYIAAPCIICAGTQVRHCAFIRGSAILGEGCVVGNSTEIKNSILFDGVQVPHFNYVGDSILGYKAHLGAGAVTSNVKSDRTFTEVKFKNDKIFTGLKKFGAIIGNFAEIGCNTVLNPATVIGANTTVYPLSCVRGAVPPDSIYKSADNIVIKG